MTSSDTSDRIACDIIIAAPRERVWQLVSEPGWWINAGSIVEHRIETTAPERFLVHDPVHGAFAVARVASIPPDYVAFRWYPGPDAALRGELNDAVSTLIEFFVSPTNSGPTHLRVVESGFAALSSDEFERRRIFDDNTAGWEQELLAADAHLGGAWPVTR